MNELFRCARCGTVDISEVFDSHKCRPKINGNIRVIEADYWISGKHPETQEDLISVIGMDGTTFWIVKRAMRPSDKKPYSPNESLQGGDQTDIGQNRKNSAVALSDLGVNRVRLNLRQIAYN